MRVRGKRLGARGQLFGGPPHDGNVHLVAVQQLDQLLAVAHRQFDFYALVLTPKLRQQARHKVFGSAHHAYGQRAHL